MIAARGAVESARTRAEQTLYQTADDAGPDHASLSLQGQCEELQRRIAERLPVLQASERHIQEQQTLCERIASGDISPPYVLGQTVTGDSKVAAIKRLYVSARERLNELYEMVAAKPSVEKANAADQAELARLQAKIGEANQAALLRLSKPENMKWCE